MSSRWAGPSRKPSTPATVQCQKCLQRGHYSYECKGSVQERPYVPRPSRTQRLLNPKLAPKLAEPAPVEDKAALADEELAKREAQRAKKRKMEEEEEDGDDDDGSEDSYGKRGDSPRARSPSSASERSPSSTRQHGGAPVNGSSRRSRSPRSDNRDYRRVSNSPVREPRRRQAASRSVSCSRSRSRSLSPPRRRHETSSRSRPLPPSRHRESSRSRSPEPHHGKESPRLHSRRRLDESTEYHSERRARSPVTSRAALDYHDRGGSYYRERDRRGDDRRQENHSRQPRQESIPPRAREQPVLQPRKRSLSPFSKRLALTQALNAADRR